MRALTVQPGVANSIQLTDVPPPPEADGALLVRAVALGICGTDHEIISGEYGWAPSHQQRLILGHESLGRIEEAPAGSGFVRGDLVVGIVRRPDPVPCQACAVGEWDMCRNGLYTERGIKERNGYGAEYFRLEPEFAVKVDPALGLLAVLLEPTSIVAKAWDHIERIGQRTRSWRPRTLLVTGAGPVGLLAALLGKQRGLEIHVLDRNKTGPKPDLVRALGATYYTGSLRDLHTDIVMECTGASEVILEVIERAGPAGIVCLAGVSSGGHKLSVDVGSGNRDMVLENNAVFGSVNANRRHYELAAEALARADKSWLGKLITRRVPLSRWHEAFKRQPGDIKVLVDFSDGA
ncbi:MAG TPA: glucose 1-dehydrogenase [Pseudolabrys sp.]|jgi:threonine dehydrogenase-like Zn-dependent dehydrogenase|nr:glucose 1-dehydrogenase [Pseudolabrys sp.]